jgi:hypothetical protein
MAAIIRVLSTSKALEPNRIPNEILKILIEEILESIAQGASILFVVDTLSGRLKKSTIIALRKEGKKNYSLSSSYRLIALENTIAKIVEKVLANRLNNVAKKYTLLL